MTCDTAVPAKAKKEIDMALAVYRDCHRLVARYTLILKDHVGEKAPFIVIQPDMHYNAATQECERLNNTLLKRFFSLPVYSIILENQKEARLSVQIAVGKYWQIRGSISTVA